MHGWLGAVETLVLLVVLLSLSLLLLAARRRWLDRSGGAFECSLRLRTTTPGSGWALGVARYNEGTFEWFRFFSSPRPRRIFDRGAVRVLEAREPNPVEAVALNADQRIIRVEVLENEAHDERELAMSP